MSVPHSSHSPNRSCPNQKPNNHNPKIAESFRRFGITPNTSNLLLIKISTPSQPHTAEAIQAHLIANLEGKQVEFSDEVLGSMTDLAKVRKIYKLNSGGGKVGKGLINGTSKEDTERRELEVLILGSMALRGAN
jgi:EKC/KEOPS complex subunit CGI121/TPRKB